MLYEVITQIDTEDKDIQTFFAGINRFAFSDELYAFLEVDKNELIRKKDKKVVELLLADKGLNYGNLPKALLTFHKYSDGSKAKAIDEHLIEGSLYCSNSNNKIAIHFTVSEEHIELIKSHLSNSVPALEIV